MIAWSLYTPVIGAGAVGSSISILTNPAFTPPALGVMALASGYSKRAS